MAAIMRPTCVHDFAPSVQTGTEHLEHLTWVVCIPCLWAKHAELSTTLTLSNDCISVNICSVLVDTVHNDKVAMPAMGRINADSVA